MFLVVGEVLVDLPGFGFGVGALLRLEADVGVFVGLLGVFWHVVEVVLGGGDLGLPGGLMMLEGMGRGAGEEEGGQCEQGGRWFHNVHVEIIGAF